MIRGAAYSYTGLCVHRGELAGDNTLLFSQVTSKITNKR